MRTRNWVVGSVALLLYLGAFVALVGGGVLAIFQALAPDTISLESWRLGYGWAMAAFLLFGILALLGAALEKLAAPPTSAPPLTPLEAKTTLRKEGAETKVATLFGQVKTYIDLEMWELAYDKAQQILKNFPESGEAHTLARNINELRWKAEPKFIAQDRLDGTQEHDLLERGLQGMLGHVKTYMELGMWELAHQKSLTIMKNFPDSSQSSELAKLYPDIERNFRESSGREDEDSSDSVSKPAPSSPVEDRT